MNIGLVVFPVSSKRRCMVHQIAFDWLHGSSYFRAGVRTKHVRLSSAEFSLNSAYENFCKLSHLCTPYVLRRSPYKQVKRHGHTCIGTKLSLAAIAPSSSPPFRGNIDLATGVGDLG
jgi:hypothetical protein